MAAPPASAARAPASLSAMAARDFVLREASRRSDLARDSEEAATLKACLGLCRAGDPAAAAQQLADRLAHLMRRRHAAIAGAPESDDDEEETVEEGEPVEAGAAPPPPLPPPASFLDADFWRAAVDNQLLAIAHCAPSTSAPPPASAVVHAADHLHSTGWAKLPAGAFSPDHAVAAAATARAMDALFARDLPPNFVFLFDEVWGMVENCWSLAEQLLGGACTLEPTFAAYRLRTKEEEPESQPADTANAKAGGGRYLGTNFGGAHRDYTYAESFTAAGKARLVTVWVPLVDVGVDTGCMHVVPREFDAHYEGRGLLVSSGKSAKPGTLGMHEHRHVCTVGAFSGLSFLHFPLYGSRPLAPVEAGAALLWTGNLIHWGAPYHNKGGDGERTPRRSIGVVFRRVEGARAEDAGSGDDGPITRDAARAVAASGDARAALAWRLRRIRQSLGAFTHWHDVPEALKACFEDAL